MLDLDTLLAAGLEKSTADSYRDTEFIAPLKRLLGALNHEAKLNGTGYQFHQDRLIG